MCSIGISHVDTSETSYSPKLLASLEGLMILTLCNLTKGFFKLLVSLKVEEMKMVGVARGVPRGRGCKGVV